VAAEAAAERLRQVKTHRAEGRKRLHRQKCRSNRSKVVRPRRPREAANWIV